MRAAWDTNVKSCVFATGVQALHILGHTYFTSVWVCTSYSPSLPQAARKIPAPDRPLPPPKHIPPPGDTDIPMFSRPEYSVNRHVALNAVGRETEVICYGIMIPSPITPLMT